MQSGINLDFYFYYENEQMAFCRLGWGGSRKKKYNCHLLGPIRTHSKMYRWRFFPGKNQMEYWISNNYLPGSAHSLAVVCDSGISFNLKYEVWMM